jgi:ribosomal-protein-alanine N-acetyltransferase
VVRRAPVAIGQQISLARPRPGDRGEFLAAVERSRELHAPWIYAPSTTAEWNVYLRRTRGNDRRAFHVRRMADDALVGVINVNDILRHGLQQAFVGYYALAPHSGRGYMTEALRLVVAECFGPLDLHRLEANIQPGNDRSKALVGRVGFRYEGFSPRYLRVGGQWRDHERWAITREEWEPR